MRSRLTALLTVGILALGTGGALAGFGGDFGSGSNQGGSAGFHEYRCDREHDQRCRCDHGFSFGRDGRCHDKGGDSGDKGGKGSGGDKGGTGGDGHEGGKWRHGDRLGARRRRQRRHRRHKGAHSSKASATAS